MKIAWHQKTTAATTSQPPVNLWIQYRPCWTRTWTILWPMYRNLRYVYEKRVLYKVSNYWTRKKSRVVFYRPVHSMHPCPSKPSRVDPVVTLPTRCFHPKSWKWMPRHCYVSSKQIAWKTMPPTYCDGMWDIPICNYMTFLLFRHNGNRNGYGGWLWYRIASPIDWNICHKR